MLIFLQKRRTGAGKNGVCSVFPQGVSDKIKDTRFYYDKCWGYILLLPLLNASLSAKQILQYLKKEKKKREQFYTISRDFYPRLWTLFMKTLSYLWVESGDTRITKMDKIFLPIQQIICNCVLANDKKNMKFPKPKL